ncbi:hypothetical protein AVEN_155336-1 [Araneus ventricosus]|uniref:Uncharacterized protein n=1 Tax=Araneus ventricosus TaxID=182803 RepID=A0A4Y2PPQ9_ARAVE|nr:hypothetical protein AVEN_231712-1 [Araneus ventricosus]GBN53840.1 hypothetical protein AVEN_57993-1 [Araneus ventricosus]GBN53889.1 hypothetical protein AVEN_146025-1 [Araneus ventricosus]GBN53895.1 hypothetical protein AVEN_155336-1 [Araneus ventricosus]
MARTASLSQLSKYTESTKRLVQCQSANNEFTYGHFENTDTNMDISLKSRCMVILLLKNVFIFAVERLTSNGTLYKQNGWILHSFLRSMVRLCDLGRRNAHALHSRSYPSCNPFDSKTKVNTKTYDIQAVINMWFH